MYPCAAGAEMLLDDMQTLAPAAGRSALHDTPSTQFAETQPPLNQPARLFELDTASFRARNKWKILAAATGSRQVSMEITCAVDGNTDNLFPGIDRTRIEEKQRRVGRDERVEIDQRPAIQPDECARIEVRVERYANDVAVIVDAEGDAI